MKQPKNKLPWFILGDGIGTKETHVAEHVESVDDLLYCIEACNNYPKAVELLWEACNYLQPEGVIYDKIKKFLNEQTNS